MHRLEIDGISLRRFGGVYALQDVSMHVAPGELVAIIGPNGAGKTSLINCISGVYRPGAGTVKLEGRDVTRLPPAARTRLGLARHVPEHRALFQHMTVLENMMVGRHFHQRTGLFTGRLLLRAGPSRGDLGAEDRRGHHRFSRDRTTSGRKVVHTLAYGLQKRVELARALALEPSLLLLDERWRA